MKYRKILEIDMLSYWYVGTGKGAGVGVDSIAFQTQSGLPVWPGKSLKGVFRDAYKQAMRLPHFETSGALSLTTLFGPSVDGTIPDEASGTLDVRSDGGRGALRFSDARVAVGEKYLEIEAWARSKDGAQYTPYFYDEIPNIAMEDDGTTKDTSLRLTQVVKPIKLYAEIEFVGSEEEANQAFDGLEKMFPLIRLMGGNRTRGYGQLSLRFQDTDGEG